MPLCLMKLWHGSFQQPKNLYGLHIEDSGNTHDALFKVISRPSPTHLSIVYCKLKNLNIGWGNLTHVVLNSVAFHKCIDLIQCVPLLESLSLGYCEASDIQNQPVVRHPQLCYFNMGLNTIADIMPFMNVLDFPSLEELVWSYYSYYSNEIILT